MNRYPVTNYVPHNPNNKMGSITFGHSLDDTLKRNTYEKIINDPSYHFKNAYVTNFDIIHHECRGDKLENSKEYYRTIYAEHLNNEIKEEENKTNFVKSAIECERKDVFLTKEVITDHFNRNKLEEKLQKDEVFLSSMKRRAYFRKKKLKKYTEDCKSLFFV